MQTKQQQTPQNVQSKIYKSYFVDITNYLELSHREYAVMREDGIQEGLNLPYPEIDRADIMTYFTESYFIQTGKGSASGVDSYFFRKGDHSLRVDFLLKSTVVSAL